MTADAIPRRSGSESEERIRMKCEAAMREVFPSARIIHELVLAQGGIRIDLAAVMETRIVAIEIKSERDVLKRLPDQVKAMRETCDGWLAVVADKHLDKAREIAGWVPTCGEDEVRANLGRLRILESICNSGARMEMLWADELRTVAEYRGARRSCIIAASDKWGGAEIRRRVCAALRAREFPRADAPILSDLFPVASRFLK